MDHNENQNQTEKQTLAQRWETLQPSKPALAWACAGAVAATLAIGFTWGGWVTGGTAAQMTERAANTARAELAAAICVENFLNANNYRAQLTELQEISSSFRQRQFVEEGGWAIMPGSEQADRQAANLCAQSLAAMELAPATSASTTPELEAEDL